MGYVIVGLIILVIVVALVVPWSKLLDKPRDKFCEDCDPDTCPFPPCYDCPKLNTKKDDSHK